jgi:hypothetical protein
MTSTGKAAVRSFLNIVSSNAEHTHERGGGLEARKSSDSGSGTGSGTSRALLQESIQIRLADGLLEASRAENYEHVMKGAEKNRQHLENLSSKAVTTDTDLHQDHEDGDDDRLSEVSRFSEVMREPQLKTVKSFTLRSIFSKQGGSKEHNLGPVIADRRGYRGDGVIEQHVNRYVIPEASISGDSPFLVPFATTNSVQRSLSTSLKGIVETFDGPYSDHDQHKLGFHIRHHDFDPNLFVFGEDGKRETHGPQPNHPSVGVASHSVLPHDNRSR